MVKFDDLNEKNSTIVEINNLELRTTQTPYITDRGEFYRAHALDCKGNHFEIYWLVKDIETIEEADSCGWDTPTKIVRYNI